MKIDANSIKVGNLIEYSGKLWVVARTMHTQPGKGGAYMQVEMKSIDGKTKMNVRFRSSEFVERAHLETSDYQYLYKEESLLHLMDNSTYEQISVPAALLGEQLPFLSDGIIVTVDFYQNNPVVARLPDSVSIKVTECEPSVKGQTATSSYKPALLDNGLRIMVPQFINDGDQIIVKTETREYVERA